MIEVYIALSLLSLGYLFNQNKNLTSEGEKKIDPRDLPSQKSLHESDHTQTVKEIEARKAHELWKKAQLKDSGVIDKNHGLNKADAPHQKNKVYSSLFGKPIDKQSFVHNNMVPFFKGKSMQTAHPDAFQSKVETFTGNPETYKQKKEVPRLFKPQKDMSNLYGMPNMTNFVESRIPVPTKHSNVLPFKQEKVAPGVGLKPHEGPQGKNMQLEERKYVMPKTVDELRAANNPKVTYEGRVIEGQKGQKRAPIGKVAKNRVDKFYKQTPDMYLKTTGAYLKPRQAPKHVAKDTNRQDTTQAYKGIAADTSQGRYVDGKYRAPHKQSLGPLNKGPANISDRGRGNQDDYGRQNIQVYANNRDTTTLKTYQGNLTSLVKAMIAPFEDVMKFSRKEYLVDNPRAYGQMRAQIPSKQPVHDPNDVARTTIKETTLSEAEQMNLKGPTKGVVYDPNSVARTTIKETTLSEPERMNLKGPVRSYVYDPNSIARTTVKETTLSEADRLNLKGPTKGWVHDPNDIARTTIKETTLTPSEVMNLKGMLKGYVHDPNDIARTTIKETTLSEAEAMNLKGNKYASIVFDPNDKTRVTIRETLENVDTHLNLKGPNQSYVKNPNDKAKTTIKETTIENDYLGIVSGFLGNKGVFRDGNYQVKDTHKQYLSDHEYYGGVGGASSHEDGYLVAPTDIKDTTRQFTSDNEYFGTGEDYTTHLPPSYEHIYNAEIDDTKEILNEGREPVCEGVKIPIGAKDINMGTSAKELPYEEIYGRQFENPDRLPLFSQERQALGSFTRLPDESERIDDRLLTARIDPKMNPYVTSII